MYEAYWQLHEKPFENTPDPRFLFASSQHEEGLFRLLYCVRESKGAGLLTGIFGCGKTLLARVLMRELEQDIYKVALITDPLLSPEEFILTVGTRLGAQGLPTKRTELLTNVALEALTTVLEDNARDGRRSVLIVDEAHVIEERAVWQRIRMLLNAQQDDRFLITLLLLGQPELKTRIQADKPLSQRIALRCHLESLKPEETTAYVSHRLAVAGRKDGELFTPEALRLIHEKSGGIPRRINHLCDLALLVGFGKKERQIDEAVIREVAADLEGV